MKTVEVVAYLLAEVEAVIEVERPDDFDPATLELTEDEIDQLREQACAEVHEGHWEFNGEPEVLE